MREREGKGRFGSVPVEGNHHSARRLLPLATTDPRPRRRRRRRYHQHHHQYHHCPQRHPTPPSLLLLSWSPHHSASAPAGPSSTSAPSTAAAPSPPAPSASSSALWRSRASGRGGGRPAPDLRVSGRERMVGGGGFGILGCDRGDEGGDGDGEVWDYGVVSALSSLRLCVCGGREGGVGVNRNVTSRIQSS